MSYTIGRKINPLWEDSDIISVKIETKRDLLNDDYLYCQYFYIPAIKDFYRRKERKYEFLIKRVDFTLSNTDGNPKIEYMFGITNRLAEVYLKSNLNQNEKGFHGISQEEDNYYKSSLAKFMYHDKVFLPCKAATIEDINFLFNDATGFKLSNEDISKLIVPAY